MFVKSSFLELKFTTKLKDFGNSLIKGIFLMIIQHQPQTILKKQKIE